jgi:hypothetical protein
MLRAPIGGARLGSPAKAAKSYAQALALVTNERRFLERRLHAIRPPGA